MGTINRETRITCGGFWLSPPTERPHKYPYWRLMWYDATDEQTRGVAARRIDDHGQEIKGRAGLIRTMSEADERLAREALARHASLHPEIVKREAPAAPAGELLQGAAALTAESLVEIGAQVAALKAAAPPKKIVPQPDLPLVTCITHYCAVRQAMPSLVDALDANATRTRVRRKKKRSAMRDALRNVMQIWGNPMVSELDSHMQDHFIATLRAQGISDWTILTRLKAIWAAIRYMAHKRFLLAAAIPLRTAAPKWDPPAQLRNRNVKLTLEELAALFDEAWKVEHCWRYMIKETGEAARPMAPCETTPANLDEEVGNIDLLEVEAQGVQNGGKRKAIIRCCPTLLAHLKVWAREEKPAGCDPHFITYQGRALASMHFFRELAKRAGVVIPRRAGAYIVRHTWGTFAARCGVPEIQRKFVMGQAVAEGAHGFYLHYETEYCGEAVDATELLYHLIAGKMKNRIAARALLILGTEALDVRPSREAAAACAAASRRALEARCALVEEQPVPEGLEGAWPSLAARGLWVMRSPWLLRGSSSDLETINQGLSGRYKSPDKETPSE